MVYRTAFCTFLMALLPTPWAEAGSSRRGPEFPRIANCYGIRLNPWSTEKDIEEIARFNLLIGGTWLNWEKPDQVEKFRAVVAEVRRRNPHIIIIEFPISAPYVRTDKKDFPETGYLLDVEGRRINGWPGTEMINLTKSETIKWLVDRATKSVNEYGYEGVFIDCMGPHCDHWACEIASGKPYTIDADLDGKPDEDKWLHTTWKAAKLDIAKGVRRNIGRRAVFMANQAGRETSPYLNGILLEDYLDYVLDHGRSWKEVLDDYLWWCENSVQPTVTTIVSSSGIEPPYEMWRLPKEEQEKYYSKGRALLRRMRFGLATTLMGDGYFAYDLHTRARGQRWWYPEYDVPLGYPRSKPKEAPDGTWRRDFDGGVAVCNPTMFDAVVTFKRYYEDAATGKVATSFVVPAEDGRVLAEARGPAKEGRTPDPSPLFHWQGPEPLVERDGKILMRFERGAAVFNERGVITTLTRGPQPVVRKIGPVIVKDNRWKDFDTVGVSHEFKDGRLVFKGERVDGDMRTAFVETITAENDALVIKWDFRALTPVHFHAFRLAADLPVELFAEGRAKVPGRTLSLPRNVVQGTIVRQWNSARFVSKDASCIVEASLSDTANLHDERNWGVQAYRITCHPIGGDVPVGKEWSFEMRLRLPTADQ